MVHASDGPEDGHPTWIHAKNLGQGSYGRAALFVKFDENGHINDHIVIKMCLNESELEWDDEDFSLVHPRDADGRPIHGPRLRQPREAFLEQLVSDHPNIVRCLGHRIVDSTRHHRIYTEYCPYGNMTNLLATYLLPPLSDDIPEEMIGEPREVAQMPEDAIWYMFLCLARACRKMQLQQDEADGHVLPYKEAIIHQ